MSEEREMIIRKRGLSPTVQRRHVQGGAESEADAVRDAFLQAAGTQPVSAASALGFSDDSTRACRHRMQEERGNGFVQRVVAEERELAGWWGFHKMRWWARCSSARAAEALCRRQRANRWSSTWALT